MFLDQIEKNGQGLNLTLQTLDGILTHNGELNEMSLGPDPLRTFAELDAADRRPHSWGRLRNQTMYDGGVCGPDGRYD